MRVLRIEDASEDRRRKFREQIDVVIKEVNEKIIEHLEIGLSGVTYEFPDSIALGARRAISHEYSLYGWEASIRFNFKELHINLEVLDC